MASDLARGERIKLLRKGRHLTQPAVADAVGVTLRAYQEWEAGGGITWANAQALGKFFKVPPESIMADPDEDIAEDADRSARMEAKLDELYALIQELRRDLGSR